MNTPKQLILNYGKPNQVIADVVCIKEFNFGQGPVKFYQVRYDRFGTLINQFVPVEKAVVVA